MCQMSDVVKSLRKISVESHGVVKPGLQFRRGIQEALNEKATFKEAWPHKDSEHKGIRLRDSG